MYLRNTDDKHSLRIHYRRGVLKLQYNDHKYLFGAGHEKASPAKPQSGLSKAACGMIFCIAGLTGAAVGGALGLHELNQRAAPANPAYTQAEPQQIREQRQQLRATLQRSVTLPATQARQAPAPERRAQSRAQTLESSIANLGPTVISAHLGGREVKHTVYSAGSVSLKLHPGDSAVPVLPQAGEGQYVKISLPKGHDPRLDSIIADKKGITYEDVSRFGSAGVSTRVSVSLMAGQRQVRSYNFTLQAQAAGQEPIIEATKRPVTNEVRVLPEQRITGKSLSEPSKDVYSPGRGVGEYMPREIIITPDMKPRVEKHEGYTIISEYRPLKSRVPLQIPIGFLYFAATHA